MLYKYDLNILFQYLCEPTSFLFSTWWNPASAAIFLTKSLVSPASGNMDLRKASWEIWLRKKVWSLSWSAPLYNLTAKEEEEMRFLGQFEGVNQQCATMSLPAKTIRVT